MNKTVFNFQVRTTLKLSEVENIIRQKRIIVPCPSRQTLIGMCEDGTLESVGKDTSGDPKPTSLGWLVYEDSFVNWVRQLAGVALAA